MEATILYCLGYSRYLAQAIGHDLWCMSFSLTQLPANRLPHRRSHLLIPHTSYILPMQVCTTGAGSSVTRIPVMMILAASLHSRLPHKLLQRALNPKPYVESQGDLVSGLIRGITRITIWVIGVINLLTKSP